MHRIMRDQLPIDRVEVCYEPGGQQSSEFRKPRPGMLLRAAKELDLDLARSFMVGDRWRDIDCGYAAGCKTIFIDRGYDEALKQQPDFTAADLPSAAKTHSFAIRRIRLMKPIADLSTAPTASKKHPVQSLGVKIFADGADKAGMLDLYANPLIHGLDD